jgi:multidrug efflux pump subunit AcrA (membrane-fusion protein)
MKKRQIIILVSTIAILLVGYGGCSLLAGQKKAPERKEAEKVIRLVVGKTIANDTLTSLTPLNGKLIVKEKIEIFPEVTGKLIGGSHPFRMGQSFKKGEVLLAMDGQEAALNLQAQRSAFLNQLTQVLPDIKIDHEGAYQSWKAYMEAQSPMESLEPLPEVASDALKRFLSGRNIYQQFYNVKSLEERQSKFTIVAPFDGVVSMGNAYAGTLLRAGQKVGEFIRNDAYELEAAVPAEDAVRISLGDPVNMHLKGDSKTFVGKVVRIAGNVDPMSQRVSIYASMVSDQLKEGLYMEGNIAVDEVSDAVYVNRNVILEDDYVFIIESDQLRKRKIEVVDLQGDNALIKGLKNGEVLLNQFIEGAYEGMAVQVEQEDQAS